MYGTEAAELLEGTFFLLLYCQRTVWSTSPAMIHCVSKRIQTCRRLLRSSPVLKMWHVYQLRAITSFARSTASTWLNACREEHTVYWMSLEFHRNVHLSALEPCVYMCKWWPGDQNDRQWVTAPQVIEVASVLGSGGGSVAKTAAGRVLTHRSLKRCPAGQPAVSGPCMSIIVSQRIIQFCVSCWSVPAIRGCDYLYQEFML